MKHKMKWSIVIGLSIISSTVSAAPTDYSTSDRDLVNSEISSNIVPIKNDHYEIMAAPGIANLKADNLTNVVATSSETDTLEQTNSDTWKTFAPQLGAGFIHYFSDYDAYSSNVQWFTSIEPELNIYYLSSSNIAGTVSRFGDAAFGQLAFNMPTQSTRLMLDIALTIAAYNQFSIYGIGGIGSAWNRISYDDKDDSGSTCALGLSLNKRTNNDFAWEGGAGVTYAFNYRFGVSLEYLYANLGNVGPSANGNFEIISPPTFNLHTQTGLLILHIAL
jgi:opacity protein-like surface antigen